MPGTRGLMFLPYLSRAGERAPFFLDVRGCTWMYVRTRTTWEPDPERTAHYAQLHEQFLTWRTLIRDAGRSASATPVPGPRTAPRQGVHRV